MIIRPALSALARHRKVQAAFYLGNVIICEEGSSTAKIASGSRYLTQSSYTRQQKKSQDESSDAGNDQHPTTSDPSMERSMQLLNENLARREHSRAEGRQLKRLSRLSSRKKKITSNDVASWKEHMSETLEQQGGKKLAVYREKQNYYRDRELQKRHDLDRKAARAQVMAETMEMSRSKQVDESPPDDGTRTLINRPIIPGTGGLTSGTFPVLHFEKTEMLYPPSDVYPPPLVMVRDVDLVTAARALGVLRSCELEWDEKRRKWRKTTRTNEFYEQQGMIDYLDTEQRLEYLGDTVMHTICKSLIMSTFPHKSVAVYNIASAWLVSNECFSYMYEDSGLTEERIEIAKLLMEVTKKRELQRISDTLTEEERLFCEESPCPAPVLPIISHRRKADLLEAYVGAMFDLYGFPAASKWCTMLLEPWLGVIDRTPEFHADRFLSPSGEALKRAEEARKKREVDEKRRTESWWGKMRSKMFPDR
jgi:dsRNA-specific ribonuclease